MIGLGSDNYQLNIPTIITIINPMIHATILFTLHHHRQLGRNWMGLIALSLFLIQWGESAFFLTSTWLWLYLANPKVSKSWLVLLFPRSTGQGQHFTTSTTLTTHPITLTKVHLNSKWDNVKNILPNIVIGIVFAECISREKFVPGNCISLLMTLFWKENCFSGNEYVWTNFVLFFFSYKKLEE